MKKFLLIWTLLFSFISPLYAQYKLPITQDQAIEIAKKEALVKGVPEDLLEKEGNVTAKFRDCKWHVYIYRATHELVFDGHVSIKISPEGDVLSYSNW